jgi:hypothetical protein
MDTVQENKTIYIYTYVIHNPQYVIIFNFTVFWVTAEINMDTLSINTNQKVSVIAG